MDKHTGRRPYKDEDRDLVMLLQAKETRDCQQTIKARTEEWNRLSLTASEGRPRPDLWSPEL